MFFQFYTRKLNNKERYRIWFQNNFETGMEYNETEEIDYNNPYYKTTPERGLSLQIYIRSNDVPLGLPFNIASYALLMEIFARITNMQPEELVITIGDAHIYKNQIDGVKEQITRIPYELPRLVISDKVDFSGTIDDLLNSCSPEDFSVQGYKCHPGIKMPLSN
jgi:thymidylate synthase